MILQSQPSGAWKGIDFSLLEALQILEQETCNDCGNPVWHCDSKDRDLTMRVKSRICAGSRALRSHQNRNITDSKEKKNDRKKSSEWGVNYYVVPELNPQAERTDLPGRTEYYKAKAETA